MNQIHLCRSGYAICIYDALSALDVRSAKTFRKMRDLATFLRFVFHLLVMPVYVHDHVYHI